LIVSVNIGFILAVALKICRTILPPPAAPFSPSKDTIVGVFGDARIAKYKVGNFDLRFFEGGCSKKLDNYYPVFVLDESCIYNLWPKYI
jgi:hypothetical protein